MEDISYELLQVANFIHKLHTFDDRVFLFLCSGKSEFTDKQNNHMLQYCYFNHVDAFLDIPIKFRN